MLSDYSSGLLTTTRKRFALSGSEPSFGDSTLWVDACIMPKNGGCDVRERLIDWVRQIVKRKECAKEEGGRKCHYGPCQSAYKQHHVLWFDPLRDFIRETNSRTSFL
jgi:hypothetical protein